MKIEPKFTRTLHFCDYNGDEAALSQMTRQLLGGDGFTNIGSSSALRIFSCFCFPHSSDTWSHKDAFLSRSNFHQLHNSGLGHLEQQLFQVTCFHNHTRIPQFFSQSSLCLSVWLGQHYLFYSIGQVLKASKILSHFSIRNIDFFTLQ